MNDVPSAEGTHHVAQAVPHGPIRHPRRTLVVSGLLSVTVLAALAVQFLVAGDGAGPRVTAGEGESGHGGVEPWFQIFLALLIIGGAAHLMGRVARRLGQPAVVGEIAAGILLGPSVVGGLFPEFSSLVFPSSLWSVIELLAQVSLVLFMFTVGLEFDTSMLRRQGLAIGMLSQATMVVPFAIGTAAAPAMFSLLAGERADGVSFAVFIGTAVSITAFPVLARIVADTGILRTRLGSLAMVSAAINDVLAWCALAMVMVVIQAGDPREVVWTLSVGVMFAVAVFALLQPALLHLERRFGHLGLPPAGRIAVVTALVFLMAQATDAIGVHAIFGAFLAGVVLPRNSRLLRSVPEQIGTVNQSLLLPVFFATVGLNVDLVVAVSRPAVLLVGAVALAVAVVSKLGATVSVARVSGMPWRASLGLGVLMNARGITEIVVLQAGLEVGVINQDAFTVLVVMALVTTVITAPALRLLRLSRPAGGGGHRAGRAAAGPITVTDPAQKESA